MKGKKALLSLFIILAAAMTMSSCGGQEGCSFAVSIAEGVVDHLESEGDVSQGDVTSTESEGETTYHLKNVKNVFSVQIHADMDSVLVVVALYGDQKVPPMLGDYLADQGLLRGASIGSQTRSVPFYRKLDEQCPSTDAA